MKEIWGFEHSHFWPLEIGAQGEGPCCTQVDHLKGLCKDQADSSQISGKSLGVWRRISTVLLVWGRTLSTCHSSCQVGRQQAAETGMQASFMFSLRFFLKWVPGSSITESERWILTGGFAFPHNSPSPSSHTLHVLKMTCKTCVCFAKFSDSTKTLLPRCALTPFICYGVCLCNFHHLDMPGTFGKGAQAPAAETSVLTKFPLEFGTQ